MDIRTCRPEELGPLISLLDEEFIFGKERTISLQRRFPTVYCSNNLSNILLCTDGKTILSALAMRPFDWRESNEIFRGAMIGAVYTHPARRGEGLASRLLKTAAIQLRAQNMDFGVLWTGQPSFYARLGWISADCGTLGKFESNELTSEPSGNVTILPMEANASRLEVLRQNCLNTMILRRSEDYCQLPLPAERINVFWCEDHGGTAYALSGNSKKTGFLYELIGNENCFPALWREISHSYQHILINDQTDSPSHRWLTTQTGLSWENKNLAMWLPISDRVDMSRLGQWHIPYFDRI